MQRVTECQACGGTVSVQAPACPHCGQPGAPQKSSVSAGTVAITVIGGILISGVAVQVFRSPGSPAVAPQVVVGGAGVVPRVEVPSGPTAADRAKAKAQYDADVAMLRKAKPKTEAETTRLIGRKPDSVMTAGAYTHVHWYYETKEDGRDVLAIATDPSGKIIISDF